jgi:hypothetical protein
MKHELQISGSQAGAWEPAKKCRHTGRDAGIQAMDGNDQMA